MIYKIIKSPELCPLKSSVNDTWYSWLAGKRSDKNLLSFHWLERRVNLSCPGSGNYLAPGLTGLDGRELKFHAISVLSLEIIAISYLPSQHTFCNNNTSGEAAELTSLLVVAQSK